MAEGALMSAFAEPHHVWTWDDLQSLPDEIDGNDVGRHRYEIVDGALVVSPSPTPWHENVLFRVTRILAAAGEPAFQIAGSTGIDISPSYRIPDLVVVTAERMAADVGLWAPADVELVVEVVSPSSRTTDRITKPAEYAAVGVPVYLRVESKPSVTLTAYELRSGETVYTEIGTWGAGETARLERPFPVDIPIDAITPPGG